MKKFIEKQLREVFKERTHFDRDELFDFLKQFDPEMTETTLSWRIHDLLNKNVIKSIKRGVYSISNSIKYVPAISGKLVTLSKIVAREFDDLDYCLWSTEWLNDFTRHQIGTFFYLLEVERDFVEEVFNAYSESKKLRVYLDPNKDIMERYVESEISIVIKPLISRSPKQKISIKPKSKDKIQVPTLEKILVDVFCDSVTFYTVQGSEKETLFENALKRYHINFSRMLNYARRRKKESQLKAYMNEHFGDILKDILE
ncbi:MAG: hypothetical protein OEW75_14955 [Cyclobacteriaceae bacterium]|nr:hypothetical protein [Cyclobacteriaceae bacterium]